MAGDWIKMRPALLTNPRVNGIARLLESDPNVGRTLSTGFNGEMREIVSRNVMRSVTVTALLNVWGAANEHTRDGVFRNADLSDIDDIAGVPGFGAAMVHVGWAFYDQENDTVTLPNFEEYNTCGRERSAEKNAERQRRHREKKKAEKEAQNSQDEREKQDCFSNVTDNVTSNDREEKRREDITPTNVGVESAPKKRATRKCPEAFDLSDAMREWAVENAPAVDVDLATAKFRDHTFKNAISDWPGAWRNWLRNEQDFASQRRPAPAAAAPIRESFRERDERLARKKYEAITGKTHPDNLPAFDGVFGGVIDVTPAAHELEFKP